MTLAPQLGPSADERLAPSETIPNGSEVEFVSLGKPPRECPDRYRIRDGRETAFHERACCESSPRTLPLPARVPDECAHHRMELRLRRGRNLKGSQSWLGLH
jgi:hypothetical protein